MVNIWRSQSNDIYQNMAIEMDLLKNTADSHLFFWTNSAAVIIGRHQNPWWEVNIENVYKADVKVARRMTGGGAVYHDLANLNVSCINLSNDKTNMQIAQDVLAELGINVVIGERNELLYRDKKISGSAYYYFKRRFLHHYTLLVDSDLDRLWHYLTNEELALSSQAVQSVKQAVTNLTRVQRDLQIEDLIKGYASYYRTAPRPIAYRPDRHAELSNQFASWQWVYGKTPRFTAVHADTEVTVVKGRIAHLCGGDYPKNLIGKIYSQYLFE